MCSGPHWCKWDSVLVREPRKVGGYGVWGAAQSTQSLPLESLHPVTPHCQTHPPSSPLVSQALQPPESADVAQREDGLPLSECEPQRTAGQEAAPSAQLRPWGQRTGVTLGRRGVWTRQDTWLCTVPSQVTPALSRCPHPSPGWTLCPTRCLSRRPL